MQKLWEDSLKMICGFCLVRPDDLSVQLWRINMNLMLSTYRRCQGKSAHADCHTGSNCHWLHVLRSQLRLHHATAFLQCQGIYILPQSPFFTLPFLVVL